MEEQHSLLSRREEPKLLISQWKSSLPRAQSPVNSILLVEGRFHPKVQLKLGSLLIPLWSNSEVWPIGALSESDFMVHAGSTVHNPPEKVMVCL